jgi:hypothetical protein
VADGGHEGDEVVVGLVDGVGEKFDDGEDFIFVGDGDGEGAVEADFLGERCAGEIFVASDIGDPESGG